MNPGVRLFVFLGTTGVALAQWIPPEMVPRNISIQTTGGVAYLKFSYGWSCPQELGKTPPNRSGTNVNQRVFLWDNPNVFCPLDFPPPIYTNQATVVLGTFEPGDYMCNIDTRSPGSAPGFPRTISVPFTVLPEPTLAVLPAQGPGVAFSVAGTSNITYRVLSSATLTNWTLLRTAFNAPFAVTNQTGDYRFYKVEIRDEVVTFPEF